MKYLLFYLLFFCSYILNAQEKANLVVADTIHKNATIHETQSNINIVKEKETIELPARYTDWLPLILSALGALLTLVTIILVVFGFKLFKDYNGVLKEVEEKHKILLHKSEANIKDLILKFENTDKAFRDKQEASNKFYEELQDKNSSTFQNLIKENTKGFILERNIDALIADEEFEEALVEIKNLENEKCYKTDDEFRKNNAIKKVKILSNIKFEKNKMSVR